MKKELVYRAISFTDLKALDLKIEVDGLRIVGVKYKGKKAELKQLFKALYMLGLKNNQHIQVQDVCDHLTLSGDRTTNFRVIGEERTDKAWLGSGYASDEAKISSSKMKDMVGFAGKLRNGGDR